MNWLKQIPNALTVSRFGAALLFAFGPLEWRMPVFLYAVASEFLDGFLARLFKAESYFGKILDPIADKTFVLTVIVTLMAQGTLYFHELLMIGYRDLTVIGGALVVLASGNWKHFKGMDPGWIGKVTTSVQLIFLFSILYFNAVQPVLLGITTGFSILAAVFYVKFFFDQGLHVEGDAPLSSAAAIKRRREMLVLVGLSMFLGILLIFAGWVLAGKNDTIEALRQTCGAACERLPW